MKFCMAAYAAILAAWLAASPASGMRTSTSDRTITQVVKLLQTMLDKSKEDGDTERDLFAKHKCYCDTNKLEKTQEMERLTKEIGLLETHTEGLMADTGVLSTEVAKLQADMDANVEARSVATATRTKDSQAFVALEADLMDAVSKMEMAIKVLADVGADQTLEQAAADHQKFMANYKPAALMNLKETVRQALLAASAIVKKKQQPAIEAFLQAPFTGTYTAQSGEVVGILKDMRDTFQSNLADARVTEQKAVAAYSQYMDTMKAAHIDMNSMYQSKQASLGTNDGELATKKGLLADAQKQKADAEAFLDQLLATCAQKAKEYEERTMLRANEEAAISEAIAILNSDAAFETFGTVTATKSGPTALLQARALQRRRQHRGVRDVARRQAEALLMKAAGSRRSMVLTKAAALLASGNPFTVALTEIEKMIDLIAAEEKADDDNLAWCNTERTTSIAKIQATKRQITTLNGEIDGLVNAIEDPETGLKAMIQEGEDALQTNIQNQEKETKERTEDNAEYQKDIANLVEAQRLLSEALSVLKAYYSKIAVVSMMPVSLVAVSQSEPAPPSTWDGPYSGQSAHGGHSAIGMIEFILANTEKEEQAAHDSESSAQKSYEDSMAELKYEETTTQTLLVDMRKSLADKEADLLGKRKDLKATQNEKASIEAYLEQIKPGCDFITSNIAVRKANRKTEDAALRHAITLLKGTPAYQTAVALSHNETLGDCLSICAGDEDTAECKACLAKVTVPAYCAGHPGTPGC